MTSRALPKLAMRPMLPTDVPLLAEIFRAGIEELTIDDYTRRSRRRGRRPPTIWKSSAGGLRAS